MASVQVEPNHVAGSSSHWPSPHPWKLYHNPHYSPRVIIHLPSSSPRQTKNPDSPMIVVPDGGGGETELDQGYGAMSSELELCVARIGELRAELELERRMRRKAEALGEALAAELAEERRRGEAERRALLEEAVAAKAAAARAVEELEDERRMLRVAELWREERVQMKLADARAALEEKMREIDDAAAAGDSRKSSCGCSSSGGGSPNGKASPASQRGQHSPSRSQHGQESPSRSQHGQVSRREAGGGENPHIRRGIKGCVEFPRAVRVRAREERVDLVSNLECQRAQLRVLMRHRSPAGGGIGLVGGAPENLVA